MKYVITYEIYGDEGEVESGYYQPGGYRFPIPDDAMCGAPARDFRDSCAMEFLPEDWYGLCEDHPEERALVELALDEGFRWDEDRIVWYSGLRMISTETIGKVWGDEVHTLHILGGCNMSVVRRLLEKGDADAEL